jgi:outer membrane immunogenic protein
MLSMNKFIAAVALALTACSAQPVLANEFGGVYVQGTVGVDDVRSLPDSTDVVYGANAGVNVPVGDAIIGVEATVDNVFEDAREVGASARLGYTFGNTMLYGEAGYTNYRDVFSRELDGLRVGGGVEYNLSDLTFISAEYRYTDFEKNAGKHAGLVGLGLRF